VFEGLERGGDNRLGRSAVGGERLGGRGDGSVGWVVLGEEGREPRFGEVERRNWVGRRGGRVGFHRFGKLRRGREFAR